MKQTDEVHVSAWCWLSIRQWAQETWQRWHWRNPQGILQLITSGVRKTETWARMAFNISWFDVSKGVSDLVQVPLNRWNVQKWLNKWPWAMPWYLYVNCPPDETLMARQSLFNNPLFALNNSALARKPCVSLCVIQNHSLKQANMGQDLQTSSKQTWRQQIIIIFFYKERLQGFKIFRFQA